MSITVSAPKLKLKAGQPVVFRSLADTNEVAYVVCMADSGTSVLCRIGNQTDRQAALYLPVRLFGIKWNLN